MRIGELVVVFFTTSIFSWKKPDYQQFNINQRFIDDLKPELSRHLANVYNTCSVGTNLTTEVCAATIDILASATNIHVTRHQDSD